MNCYACKAELIWGCDYDTEEGDDHLIMTCLSCSECNAEVVVYWGKKEESDDSEGQLAKAS